MCRVNWVIFKVHFNQELQVSDRLQALYLIVSRNQAFQAHHILEPLKALYAIVRNLESRQIAQRAHYHRVKLLKAVEAEVENLECLRQTPHLSDLVARQVEFLEEG